MPKKTKKNKILTKAEEKLAKYKRGLTTSTLAAEAAPVLSDLLSGFFDDGGLIRERAKPIAEPYRPRSPKSKRKPKKPIAEPYRPQGQKQKKPAKPITGPYKPREIERSKFKDLIKPREMEKSTPRSLFAPRQRKNLNKGGKVDKGKELANKIMPFNSKVKFRKEGINLVPVFPKGYKPPVSKMPKYKPGRKYMIQSLKKGGSITVPTKLGRTKKTRMY